jgi:hypothetical protein
MHPNWKGGETRVARGLKIYTHTHICAALSLGVAGRRK